jgi:hypothetical protein
MKHLILFALIAGCAGCVDTALDDSDVQQDEVAAPNFCPVADQEAGICDGPFTALMARTREEIPANGIEIVSQASCGMQGVAVCHVMYTIPIPLAEIVVSVTCTKAANGQVTCITTVS